MKRNRRTIHFSLARLERMAQLAASSLGVKLPVLCMLRGESYSMRLLKTAFIIPAGNVKSDLSSVSSLCLVSVWRVSYWYPSIYWVLLAWQIWSLHGHVWQASFERASRFSSCLLATPHQLSPIFWRSLNVECLSIAPTSLSKTLYLKLFYCFGNQERRICPSVTFLATLTPTDDETVYSHFRYLRMLSWTT